MTVYMLSVNITWPHLFSLLVSDILLMKLTRKLMSAAAYQDRSVVYCTYVLNGQWWWHGVGGSMG